MNLKVVLVSRQTGIITPSEAQVSSIVINGDEYMVAQNKDGSSVAVKDGVDYDIRMGDNTEKPTSSKTIIDLIGSRPKNINISF